MLGKYAHPYGFSGFNGAAARGQISAERAQQGCLSGAVSAYNAHAVVPQQGIGKVPHQRAAAQLAAQVLAGENFLPQSTCHALHLQLRFGRRFAYIFLQNFKTVDTALGFCAAGACAALNPGKLGSVQAFLLAQGGCGHLFPLSAFLQIARIIRLIGLNLSAAHLENAVENPLQQVAVMRNTDQCAAVVRQIILQPRRHVQVNVVGRFIQQQYVCLAAQDPGQRHPHLLTAGQLSDPLLKIRKPQAGQNGLRLIGSAFPLCLACSRYIAKCRLGDAVLCVQKRGLGQISERQAALPGNIA